MCNMCVGCNLRVFSINLNRILVLRHVYVLNISSFNVTITLLFLTLNECVINIICDP